jgi:hypothetical protein
MKTLRMRMTEKALQRAEAMRTALRFYGSRSHWHIEDAVRWKWDTVSGEAQNWHYRENGKDAAEGLEDGTIAARTLRGEEIDWEGDEPHPIEGET